MRFRHHASHPRAAFTLVELLVVIGIIALLISILLPALGRARAQANSIKCQANLHSIGLAINIYAVDYKGSLPEGFWDGNPLNGGVSPNPTPTDWSILLVAELVHGAGDNWTTSATSGANNSSIRRALACPDAPDGPVMDPSGWFNCVQYACHPRLMPNMQSSLTDPLTGAIPLPYKLAHIRNVSQVALIFDTSLTMINHNSGPFFWLCDNTVPIAYNLDGRGYSFSGTAYLTNNQSMMPANWLSGMVDIGMFDVSKPAKLNAKLINRDVPVLGTLAGNNPCTIRFRHVNNTIANVLMADGHVQSYHYNATTKLTDMPRSTIYVNQ